MTSLLFFILTSYPVAVTRIQQDLYKDELSGKVITTVGCSEIGFRMEADLLPNHIEFVNKIDPDDYADCVVVKVSNELTE